MNGTRYRPERPEPARCTRSADRRAIRFAVLMTLCVMVVAVGSLLLLGTFFPSLIDPSESWLGYAASVQ